MHQPPPPLGIQSVSTHRRPPPPHIWGNLGCFSAFCQNV
jgi:hypothetical protein